MKLINTALIAIQCIILIVVCVMYLLMQRNDALTEISWSTSGFTIDSVLQNSTAGEAALNK